MGALGQGGWSIWLVCQRCLSGPTTCRLHRDKKESIKVIKIPIEGQIIPAFPSSSKNTLRASLLFLLGPEPKHVSIPLTFRSVQCTFLLFHLYNPSITTSLALSARTVCLSQTENPLVFLLSQTHDLGPDAHTRGRHTYLFEGGGTTPGWNTSSAAAPLLVQHVALLHAVDANVLAPLPAVLLALRGAEPAAVARVVARLALDELGERARVFGDAGGRGQDAGGESGEDDEEGGLHFDD